MRKSPVVFKLAATALLAALCYVSFTYLKIPIRLPGGDTVALHVGNAFCVLAALLLGGVYGGLAGAVGMTIADLMDPVYITSAPKTFFLKFFIGLITGIVAHQIAKINENKDKKYQVKWACISAISGLTFNVIFDPIVRYFYTIYVLGGEITVSEIAAKFSAIPTFVNAVISVILVTFIYASLKPVLARSGLLPELNMKPKSNT